MSTAPAERTASPPTDTDVHSIGAGACFAGLENSIERILLDENGLPFASRSWT